MVRLSNTIRSFLVRLLPSWRERLVAAIIVIAILFKPDLLLGWWRVLVPGLEQTKSEPAYWQKPLTCHGPDFRDPLPDPESKPNEPRSIFRMSDRVVLAIPRHYLGGPWDENLPATVAHCGSIDDLPQIQHLYIRIKGQWSGAYDVRDLPRDNNGDLEYPDIVGLHVLPPDVRPAWAAQKPVWNRKFIETDDVLGPLESEGNGILCHRDMCWVPVPGADDLYGWFQPLGGANTAFSPLLLRGVTLRGLEISGRVTLHDPFQTLPAVIQSIQDHIDLWNIVRPKGPTIGRR
jgi:hypothetical protein